MTFDFLSSVDPNLWTGRADTLENERFFQKIKCQNLQTLTQANHHNQWVLMGFETDEGILRNEGRIGAKLAPNAIRQALGRLASHQALEIYDVGNLACHEHQLEKASHELSQALATAQKKGYKTLVLGGGHELAYGHFMGLSAQHSSIGIINIDAHFDLRTPLKGRMTSGTPFFQIATHQKLHKAPFRYCALGIQPQANTASLYQKASELEVKYREATTLITSTSEDNRAFIQSFIDEVDVVYLTLCMDVFAQDIAPGVSAPQPFGLYPWQILPLLEYIIDTQKVISLDLVEISPPWDEEQKTIKLGAQILARLLDRWAQKS